MQRITVLGAGFGALTAARRLRKKAPAIEVTLVAPEPTFLFYPSLIWIPARLRSGDDLRIDLEPFFQQEGIHLHRGRVTALRDGGRTVVTDTGEITNDGLIIASGARFRDQPTGQANTVTICEGVPAAEQLRDRLEGLAGGTLAFGFMGNPNEPAAMRGGPMFELLFGTDTLLRRQGRRDDFRLVFFTPAPEPGKRLGDRAVAGIQREMAKRGIEPHLGHKIQEFQSDRVVTDGDEIPADLIAFMPGMEGPDWAEASGLALSDGGLFRADAHCRAEGAERVYVAGDAGSFEGPSWMPKQAHLADLQAVAAADNLAAELAGRTPTARFKPELVCIVDSLDKGILVYRTEKRTIVLPSRLLHWAKRAFEWWYLRPYRRAERKGAA